MVCTGLALCPRARASASCWPTDAPASGIIRPAPPAQVVSRSTAKTPHPGAAGDRLRYGRCAIPAPAVRADHLAAEPADLLGDIEKVRPFRRSATIAATSLLRITSCAGPPRPRPACGGAPPSAGSWTTSARVPATSCVRCSTLIRPRLRWRSRSTCGTWPGLPAAQFPALCRRLASVRSPGPGKAGAARLGAAWCGRARPGGVQTEAGFDYWRTGLRARRPARPPRARARRRPANALGSAAWTSAMAHASIETVPGRVRMPLAHAASIALAQAREWRP